MRGISVSVSAVCSAFVSLLLVATLQGQDLARFREHELSRRAAMDKASAEQADASIDVSYYGLDLSVSTAPALLTGRVHLRARVVMPQIDSIRLNLADTMVVDSVTVGPVHLLSIHADDLLVIRLDRLYAAGESIDLVIHYHGLPVETGFGSFVFSSHNGIPWIWSLSEPHGARDWWPCKDHPLDKADSADVRVTCDSLFRVGSNGRLAGITDNADGTRTWWWQERHPITTYLISVAITNYAEFTNWFRYSPTDSMPVLTYVTPEHLAEAQANLPRTVDMLGIFSSRFGLYPFIDEKYGHAEFQRGGAMEHQTMTSATMQSFAEPVVAHELAHQWFGDLITCASWRHLWLNEGFATYSEAVYFEDRYGTQAYRNDMFPKLERAKTAAGPLLTSDTTLPQALFNHPLVYDKGASVLHMLRHVLGDSVFFAAMRSYSAAPGLRYRTAVTDDFRQICEAVAGRDLTWFFTEWTEGERYPTYQYTWSAVPSAGGSILTLQLDQSTGTSNPPFFTMPVDIRCSSVSAETTVTVVHLFSGQEWTIPLGFVPTTVAVDPDHWILADVGQATGVAAVPPASGDLPSLDEVYPNPCNPVAHVTYHLPARLHARLALYDLLGREVALIVDVAQEAGTYTTRLDGSGLATGPYLCRLTAGAFTAVRKIVLMH